MPLKFKTRGDSEPKGKPKVYFCCHPEDMSIYFKDISEEILSLQNCSIWYRASDGAADSETVYELEQMQLFVMPVTSRLLCSENKAISFEFKLAMEKHIPVLPLMQESGLEQLFNKKCGSIQFLDKNNMDMTAISYKDKLKKFLDSVLIGDELAEKIRSAFDAYVFLSYRKKDRKYARELMRLIHKNEFCRDVAIWYDEFLVPGEDFNSSIQRAIEKSGLFVLTVTPNLVNESNYIMTTEYPMARAAGKHILPAELVATDRALLSKSYKDLPVPTDARREEELRRALLHAVQGLSVRANDNDPMHNFFIGLAYLGGVDVEVDHERALSLITASAEAGLWEAMKKLVSMYRNGDGVRRDRKEALYWQNRLIDACRESYDKNKDKKSIKDLYESLLELGNLQIEIMDHSKVSETYLQMLAICQNDTHSHLSFQYTATCYSVLGNVAIIERKIKEAREYFELELSVYRKAQSKNPFYSLESEMARCYGNLGNLALKSGDYSGAKEYCLQAIEIHKASKWHKDSISHRRTLSVIYETLGQAARNSGDRQGAEMYIKNSFAEIKKLAEETVRPSHRLDLAASYTMMGMIAKDKGELELSKKYHLKTVEIAEQVLAVADNLQSRRKMAVGYTWLGDIARDTGDRLEASRFYNKALEIRQTVADRCDTVQSRDDLALSLYKVGSMTENEDIAYRYKREAYDIWLSLTEECPGVRIYQRRLDVAKKDLGLP